jgi:nitrogen fixation protein FixH
MESEKPRRIPDHIRYPGMVVAILGLSVVSQIFLFRAAFSNGGPQIEHDYYTRAVSFDEAQNMRDRRDALGWRVSATPNHDGLVVRVQGRDGAPIALLRGDITAQRADRAEVQPAIPLEAIPGHPGAYHVGLNTSGKVWDLRVALTHERLLVARVAPWELRIEPEPKR